MMQQFKRGVTRLKQHLSDGYPDVFVSEIPTGDPTVDEVLC